MSKMKSGPPAHHFPRGRHHVLPTYHIGIVQCLVYHEEIAKHLTTSEIQSRSHEAYRALVSAGYLAVQTVRSSYRRTVLGPVWISINQFLFVVGAGLLFAVILNRPATAHLTHVAVGISVWGFVSNTIRSATTTVPRALTVARGSSRAPWFFALVDSIEQLIIFTHTFASSVLIAFLLGNAKVGISTLVLPFFVTAIAFNGFAFSLWIGPLCARFRDIPNAVNALLAAFGFMVPTFWTSEELGNAQWVISMNPLAWPIEVVRTIVTTADFRTDLQIRLLVFTVLNLLLAGVTYRSLRSRLGLWS